MDRYRSHNLISRLLACLVALILVLSVSAGVRANASGTCGDDLTWSLTGGTLTVTGSGEMTDYPEQTMAPWYDRRGEIRSLSLPEGLTSIGDLAFYGCEELTVVNIPDTVTSIGKYAFAGCTGMTMLDLGSGLQTVEENAFSDCVSLAALQLPEGIRSIGTKAFYRCESIPALTVPEGVEHLGVSAFAYCKNLVSAKVEARIQVIPEWLFYGCHRLVSVTLPDELEQISEYSFRGCQQLTTVYYNGTAADRQELLGWIGTDVPGFSGTGHITGDPPPDSWISGTTQDNGDGTVTQQNTTAVQGSDVTASVIVETLRQEDGTGTSTSMKVQLTVENDRGWEQAKQIVTDGLNSYNSNTALLGQKDENIQIDLFIKDGELNKEFADLIAQRNISMTVSTADGSKWRLDGNTLQQFQGLDLRYTLTEGSEALCQELGTGRCFVLRFQKDAQVNAELLLSLGKSLTHQTATLLLDGSRIQSSVVDQQGNAHFYLASVAADVDYYVAMDLPQAQQEAIVPDELLDSYGRPLRQGPIQYEITGVKSSLGVTFNQFTWMLIAALVACVVIVGVVVWMLQKQKLKADASSENRRRHRRKTTK